MSIPASYSGGHWSDKISLSCRESNPGTSLHSQSLY